MPGTPPVSPNFGAPRFSDDDPASFSEQLNAVTDTFDAQASKRTSSSDVSHTSLTLTGVDETVLTVQESGYTIDSAAVHHWGGDTNLYRSAPANAGRATLTTDNAFQSGTTAVDSIAANDTRIASNYVSATDRLSDATKSSWLTGLGDGGNDRWRVARAPNSGGSPVYATLASLSSSGLLTAVGGLTLDAGSGTATQTITLTGRNANTGKSATIGVDANGLLAVDGPTSHTLKVAGDPVLGVAAGAVTAYHDLTVDGNLTVDGTATGVTPAVGDDTTKFATTHFVNTAITNALGGVSSIMNYRRFTTSGTWNVPAGVTKVTVRCVQGGGGGGGGGEGNTSFGGGGGAGGVVTYQVVTVVGDAQLTITVGAGGAVGTGTSTTTGNSGGAGGASRVVGVTTSTVYATSGTVGTVVGVNGAGQAVPNAWAGGVYGGGTNVPSTSSTLPGWGGFAGATQSPAGAPMVCVVGGGAGGNATSAKGGTAGQACLAAGPLDTPGNGTAGGGATIAGVAGVTSTMPGCGGGGGGAASAGGGNGGNGGAGAPGMVELWW